LSKGIKMNFAKKNDYGNQIFHISKLSKLNNGNLNCKYCGVEIMYVSAHTKKSSSTPVPAYLKLWKGINHGDECGYSVKGAVELLASNSNSVENNNSIFELQKDGNYLFRMNILVDAQKTAQELAQSENNFTNNQDSATRRKYIASERQLASYFRSATGIAKLRALIQESKGIEELTNLVKIQYKDKYIPWNNFYYDETRYQILFNRLCKGKITHPIAVNITVKGDIKHYDKAKLFQWSYQCYSQTVKNNQNKLVFIPALQLAKERLSKNILSGGTLLVVGDAWANKIKNETLMFRNFNISIFNKSQIKKEVDEV